MAEALTWEVKSLVNILKLKAKLVEKGKNVDYLAEHLGVNRTTIYRRLDGGGNDFTIGEVDRIGRILDLTAEEINSIFFSQYVAS